MNDLVLCAIETSCDETSVAFVRNGNELLSQVTQSQISAHQNYKGVMPELASRLHIQVISLVIEEALIKSNLTWDEVDAIAFTVGPGLVGSLHIGALAAKSLAYALSKPLIAVNHLAGHIHANAFVSPIEYPCLALVVSGGHTELVMMQGPLDFKVIAQTQDDAIGEAFDKVGRLLHLDYPAGPHIDKLAQSGQSNLPLPHLKLEANTFSYSGIKSHFNNLIYHANQRNEELNMNDVCASFQDIAIGQLINRLENAINQLQPRQVIVAGGVSANTYLRSECAKMMRKFPQIKLSIPPIEYCTDNAAMIGAAGYHMALDHQFSDLDVKVNPGLGLSEQNH
jgi:N6-L-threonylcarbamoyladenine synthase